LKKALA
jgi:Ca2+-binding EF-hand superfamily protein